jgi:putative aldouronate transport system permease protein
MKMPVRGRDAPAKPASDRHATTGARRNQMKSGYTGKKRNINPYMYIMMAPGLIYLLINNYVPMFGMFIAFKTIDYSKGIFKSDWAGLKNFKFLFQNSDALVITRNTLLYNAAFIIIGTILSIFLAIFLNELVFTRLKGVYQTVFLLPQLLSMVIISYLVFAFLSIENGYFNKTLFPLLGLEPVSWYSAPEYWPVIIITVNQWRNTGFYAIIYLASIVGIDKSYYESAMIDGASKLKQITHITLPLIKPTVIIMVLMGIGRIFYSDFGLFYQVPLNSGMLFSVTSTLDTYVYRGLIQLNNISMSSAAGVYQSFVGFILVLMANQLVRKFDEGNSLF